MSEVRAFLGMGTNLGDRWTHLRTAVGSLTGVQRVSGVFETDPVGGPGGQGPYLNLVVELLTDLTPEELLGVCHRLEAAAERVRMERWGPRTLDVDVLWIDGVEMDTPSLTVPHPRFRERRFVMVPLAELAPDLCVPGWELTAVGEVYSVGPL